MSNLLLKNFSSQYVEIVAKTSMISQGEGPTPLLIHGFVIDSDLDFLYLGSQNNIQIDSAVSKKDIVIIVISDPDEQSNLFLENDNESDEELN